MQLRSKVIQHYADSSVPARDRIANAASLIFLQQGVHAPLRAITHLADSNDATAIKYFGSREQLLSDFINSLISRASASWMEAERKHPGQPESQLREWLSAVALMCSDVQSEQCQLARAAAELNRPRKHPLLDRIEAYWTRERHRVAELCSKAGLREPDVLADKLILLVGGARNERGCFGWPGAISRLCDAADDLMVAHGASRKSPLD